MQPFTLFTKPKINLNFYKYNAIIRIDSSYDFIKFYVYYFGNYDKLREDFDQKNHVTLHTKIDLNGNLVKRTFRTVNLLNVSEMETS